MKSIEEFKNKIICGDALGVLKEIPDESIDMVITSPPYWGLRNYNTNPQIWDDNKNCEHEWASFIRKGQTGGTKSNKVHIKNQDNFQIVSDSVQDFCVKCGAWKGELGSEPTFKLYIKHLCDIFIEVKRILKKSGSFWLNLGDVYGGVKEGKTDKKVSNYVKESQKGIKKKLPKSEKCLLMMPERIAMAMIDQQGWILRNKIKWAKQVFVKKENRTIGSVMPTSVKDRFNESGEELYFFVKNKKYYSNLDAVRLKIQTQEYRKRWKGQKEAGLPATYIGPTGEDHSLLNNPLGKNLPTIWQIQSEPHNFQKELNVNADHFAIFPQALLEIPIKFGCPQQVCKKCGKPIIKIIKTNNPDGITGRRGKPMMTKGIVDLSEERNRIEKGHNSSVFYSGKIVGYSSCNCNVGFEPGIVLDPFMGSGTTAIVAKKLNRNFIGIELNPEYIKIAETRIKKECPNDLFNS